MSATEFREWQVLAQLEADVADLVAQGTDYATAEQMVWTPVVDEDEPPPPLEDE